MQDVIDRLNEAAASNGQPRGFKLVSPSFTAGGTISEPSRNRSRAISNVRSVPQPVASDPTLLFFLTTHVHIVRRIHVERAIAQLKDLLGILSGEIPINMLHVLDSIMRVAVLATWFLPPIVAQRPASPVPSPAAEEAEDAGSRHAGPVEVEEDNASDSGPEWDMGDLERALAEVEAAAAGNVRDDGEGVVAPDVLFEPNP